MSTQCDNDRVSLDSDDCDLVTNNIRLIFQVISLVFVVQIMVIFGTVSNIMNIACFLKHELGDPVTITLLDLLSLVFLIWHNICLNPWFYESDLAIWSPTTVYLTADTPHVAFTRVTCCITAFITVERCLCVVLPMTVNLIFTTKRVTIIVITIYIIILSGSLAPAYYTTRFAMLPHPRKPNTTWLDITFTQDRSMVEKYSFPIINGLLPFITFTIICVATVLLVYSLKRKLKWRKMSAASGNSASLSSRDRSVSKMVVLIAAMFVSCYTPICALFIGIIAVPQFGLFGNYKNLNSVLLNVAYILETANSSCNIFIYYNTSSRYRQSFKEVFRCLRVKGKSISTAQIITRRLLS